MMSVYFSFLRNQNPRNISYVTTPLVDASDIRFVVLVDSRSVQCNRSLEFESSEAMLHRHT